MNLPSSASCSSGCPRCGGCLPYEGPFSRVCQCGAMWEADLGKLIATLDQLLTNPGPPDPMEAP